jgi:hypothetical protein
MTYIHYGASKFDLDKFVPVKNADFGWTKPDCGGLWGSPVDSEYGWKQREAPRRLFFLCACFQIYSYCTSEAVRALAISYASGSAACDRERVRPNNIATFL